MYAGVPRTAPVVVTSFDSPRRASPKSATFGCDGGATAPDPAAPESPGSRRGGRCSSTLAGFRSRWTTPCSWAAATPRATAITTRAASAAGSAPSRRNLADRLPPLTYSMTMYGCPAASRVL